ncbi:hypothetical protein [Dyadobacter tibetensis]|uniref:hypothetical protein n=1 Tax=Dyadobacter tibetensis TaxID=1211851 RepID=UPI000472BB7F|nr:hypothetical protein [Dyadobacter tibetensis]
MDKKYVIQAFDLNLKGRFDVLAKYYGKDLFSIPAQIMIQQIKDELGITISDHSIYNLKRRFRKQLLTVNPLQPVENNQASQLPQDPAISLIPASESKKPVVQPEQDWGTIVENATKEPKGKKGSDLDFTNF